MALDYTTLWEAFASGTATTSTGGTWDTALASEDDYAERIKDFYDVIVGPAWGYDNPNSPLGFGSAFEGRLGAGSEDWRGFDIAERDFRMAIGDPYGSNDPFAWENISRYKTYAAETTEAQKLLEGELYGAGGELGGETGSAYSLSMEGQEEAYTTGMESQRALLSGGELTSGVGLASGTSGAILRSGAAITRSEDILSDVYKASIGLGTGAIEGREGTEKTLREDLDKALKIYTDKIDTEKQDWYQRILLDVVNIKGIGSGVTEDGEPEQEASLFAGEKTDWGATEDWGGLTYEGELPSGGYGFRADGACGIGELWDGTACVPEGDVTLNEYGELIGTGEGLYEFYGCMDSNACNYKPDATISDGTCVQPAHTCWDDTVVCEASDCSTQTTDECGVLGGYGPTIVCYGGEFVCNESDCEDPEPQCPQGMITTSGGDCIPDPQLEPEDCAGDPGGSAVIDECGVCEGDNSSCTDCAGVINGDSVTCWDGSCQLYTECGYADDFTIFTEGEYYENGWLYGCTDPSATNYNPEANKSAGNCTYDGATDDTYDGATDDPPPPPPNGGGGSSGGGGTSEEETFEAIECGWMGGWWTGSQCIY